MKKVLFVATVVKTHINVFHLPFLKHFKDCGWETSVCAENDFENPEECTIPNCDNYINIPFVRVPFHIKNLKAFLLLKKTIKSEQYDIIHCHTPVGGILTRLASIGSRKRHSKIIYTAHGFHFFKGAPIINWLLYFPIEWICSFFTDVLITINQEDYAFAQKHMHAKKVCYVPGVGVNVEKQNISSGNISLKRAELDIPDNAVMILSVGELSKNKNHKVILEALSLIDNQNIHYCIAGCGTEEQNLLNLAEHYGVSNRFHLLGYRTDINELLSCADIFCFPSFREGLPVSLMEAMAAGLPCVVSNIRGNKDLIQDGEGGYLCSPDDTKGFAQAINKLIKDDFARKTISKINLVNIVNYSSNRVMDMMKNIYNEETSCSKKVFF